MGAFNRSAFNRSPFNRSELSTDKILNEILHNKLSPKAIKDEIANLPEADKERLLELLKEFNLNNPEDISQFLYKNIGSAKQIIESRKISSLDSIFSPCIIKNLENLNEISYADEIHRFKLQYETCTSTDELYPLVMKTLQQLWVKKYDKNEAYQKFEIYQKYEKLLFTDSHYREHFIHQFQVFLCGLPILSMKHKEIEDHYKHFFGKGAKVEIDFSWMLAATYHDIGYLVQKYETWLNSFFRDFLDVQKMPVNFDLGQLLFEKNFQDYVDKLASLHSELINQSENSWTYDGYHKINHELRRTLTSKLISDRNHGLVSSLILLDKIENSKVFKEKPELFKSTFSSVIMPACLAIALHDKAIFSDDRIKIDFSKDPLSTILIYCDTIQEWGRPFHSISDDSIQKMPILTNYIIDNKKACATLTYQKIFEIAEKDNRTNFDLKTEEIENVLSKIHSEKFKFKIRLESKDNDHRHSPRTYESS
jgi:hypothetical protein